MHHLRIPLICSPTPLHKLERLSEQLGIELFIKRDDLTGFAGGGNKGRKLEFLIYDAMRYGADTIVTRGAYQSNFVRQTAGVCAMFGMEFHAVVMHWPYPAPGRETRPKDWNEPQRINGNMILNRWFGAHIHLLPDGTFHEMESHMNTLAEELRRKGKKVYEIPGGGSNPVGALGYLIAFDELCQQSEPFDQIIVASGSGGTQTGLTFAVRRAGVKTKVIGICTDNEPEMVEDFCEIAKGLEILTGTKLNLTQGDFDLRMEYHGGGYQVQNPETKEAIRTLAKTEGIFVDPVYTGKAFAGVLDLAKKGELKGRTLFWHTGGFPVLFAEGREPE